MSAEPKSFPRVATEWMVMCATAGGILVAVFGYAKYGFGFLTNVETGLKNVATINQEQMPAVLKGMADIRADFAKLKADTDKEIKDLKDQLARKADRKGIR